LFTKEINNLTLANDIADRLFDNITAQSFYMDRTFTATLRAVLGRRLPADKSVCMILVSLGCEAVTADIITEKIRQKDCGHDHTIYIVYPTDKSDRVLESVGVYVGEGKRYLTSYTLQEDLRVFYVRMLKGLFYSNGSNTIIFLDYLDTRRLHDLQMMIPKYLSTLFEDNPLTDDETALLKSLGSRSHGEYERLVEQFAGRLDMRSEIIKTRLKGFETVFERLRVEETNRNIEKYQKDYQAYLDNLRRTANLIQDQRIILAGLQCKIDETAEEESELMEYFLCNKQLSVMRVQGMELEFVVHGYADVYDEDAFETYFGNHNSYLYNRLGNSVTKDEMDLLYRAVFGDGKYKLRVCAAYRADMRNGLRPVQNYTFPPESQTYLPNPHIQQYRCIGGYASRFVEYMQNRDYVGAIDQAAVSARNLNFHDSAVMPALAGNLSVTTVKCIEDADGNLMTPREAIKKLKEVAGCQSQSE